MQLQQLSMKASEASDEASDSASAVYRTLAARKSEVIGLFNEWDEGDGTVSKADFRKAMPVFGLKIPRVELVRIGPPSSRRHRARGPRPIARHSCRTNSSTPGPRTGPAKLRSKLFRPY